jgi:hypothetical protein
MLLGNARMINRERQAGEDPRYEYKGRKRFEGTRAGAASTIVQW